MGWQMLECVGNLFAPECLEYLEMACEASELLDKAECKEAPHGRTNAFPVGDLCEIPDDGWECNENPCDAPLACNSFTQTTCNVGDLQFVGYSPVLGRNASAVEACCCPGFGG